MESNAIDTAVITELCWDLRRRSLREVKSESNTANALFAVVKSFTSGEDFGSANDAARERVLEPVVLMVLNHTPLQPRERDFVGALNSAKLSTVAHVESRLGNLPDIPDPGCRVCLFGGGDDVDQARAMDVLWRFIWARYAHITREGRKEHMFTWNDFLLRHAEEPRPVGICWNGCTPDNPFYIPLSSEDAREIGLPHLDSPGWGHQALSNETHLRNPDRPSPPVLQLAQAWERMRLGDRMPEEAAAWAIFHLLRYYGWWGGNALISLPLEFGTKDLNRTAVLTLGTERALTSSEIAVWMLLARELFQPLIATETVEVLRERELASAVYGLGHTLKNRITPAIKEIAEARADVRDGEQDGALFHLDKARTFTVASALLGEMLDILSVAINVHRGSGIFLQRNLRWAESSELSLLTLLETIQPDVMSSIGGSTKRVSLSIHELAQTAVVRPWIKHQEAFVRPFGLFYKELFYESLLNAATHGRPDGAANVAVQVEVAQEPCPMIILSNLCPAGFDPIQAQLQLAVDQWVPFHELGRIGGGLLYAGLCLKQTEAGRLLVRLTGEETLRFEVGFELEGLAFGNSSI
jgi:hypothetical protein